VEGRVLLTSTLRVRLASWHAFGGDVDGCDEEAGCAGFD
jgi:hypothetical protein